ncbi:reverse transcriptase family protein [Providencia vermicola]|uniref:reverse transcriptase family protein n=1 Tax=Providencia vermicola TaxID=333965 RepID=UPI001CEC1E02|nr:reverse transcriptase family protein [Providencia vermicola]
MLKEYRIKSEGKELIFYKFNLKKRGKTRLIFKVSEHLSSFYKEIAKKIESYYYSMLNDESLYFSKLMLNNSLEEKMARGFIKNVPHAFFKERSAVTNALKHIGFDLTLKLDIKDFFNNIKPRMLQGLLDEKYLDLCFINETLPQGLSTSPIISNIAMINIDRMIYLKLCSILPIDKFIFTRYADDISISIKTIENNDIKAIAKNIIEEVTLILDKKGFQINNKKTKIMLKSNGYRTITGISVNEHEIKPTRKTIKKLRSAVHNLDFNGAVGLLSWIEYVKRAK